MQILRLNRDRLFSVVLSVFACSSLALSQEINAPDVKHLQAPEMVSISIGSSSIFSLSDRAVDSPDVVFETSSSRAGCEKRSPWKLFPWAVGLTAVVYPFDDEIQEWVQERRTPTGDRIAETAKNFGDFGYMLRRLGALYLYGALAGDDRARRTGGRSIQSAIVGGIITQIMKGLFDRPRPGREPAEDPFDLPPSPISFPSGHTTVAFATATVVSCEYGDGNIITPLAYALATLTGWSRINDNEHWTSDVIFGAYVGYASARAVINTRITNDDPFSPRAAFDSPGVALRFSF